MIRSVRGQSLSKRRSRLWRLMQNIEFCRYRAEIAEGRAYREDGFRREASLATARQWRALANAFEQLEDVSAGAGEDQRPKPGVHAAK